MDRKKNFIAKVEQAIENDDGSGFFYLVSMDIAEFKQINYHYGFEAGNHLLDDLEDFINRLPQCVLCDRPGSDRFLFLTRHPVWRREEEMIVSFETCWNRFCEEQAGNYPICTLKAWCGLYYIHENDDILLGIENADLARRKAREEKRRHAVYCESSLVNEAAAQKILEHKVLESLDDDRFTYWLQPQVDAKTGKILSAEALARGIFKSGETISPAIFIPVLERTGEILKLDMIILKQVCKNLRERIDRGAPVVPISINLSRIDLRYDKLVETIDEIVTRYDIPHDYLMFEVTESVVMESFVDAKSIVEHMAELGYKISIDDFGSGFAGIDVCRKLDFDELKIDKSLVDEVESQDDTCRIIIEVINTIMERLGIRVVCEGVETAEQCKNILDTGCRIVQGYFFSKPVPSREFYRVFDSMDGQYAVNF